MENDHLADKKQRYNLIFSESYNETIPTKRAVLDLWEADETTAEFAINWMGQLFRKGNRMLPIKAPEKSRKKIEHLFFTAQNDEKIKGSKNLGFGFPILTKKDRNASSGVFAAPIFIWDIHIEPDIINNEHWQIKKRVHSNIRINPVLESIAPEVAKLIQEYKEKIQNKKFTLKGCKKFCEALATLQNYQNQMPISGIEKFPEIEDLVNIQDAGAIIWAGIIQAFPPIQSYSLSDSILSKEFWQSNIPKEISETQLQYSYLPTDHQQKAAFIAGFKHKFVLIEGASGSGKTYAVCNALMGNLLNQQKTLVVSQSVLELEKIMNQLLIMGFGEYCFLFKNMDLDRDNFIENIIAKTDKAIRSKIMDSSDFSIAYRRFKKYKTQLDQTANAYNKNVFDIYNWTETVGLYLKNNQQQEKELLEAQLQVHNYSFDFLEYEILNEKIAQASTLFKKEFAFYHPLDELNPAIFASKNPKEAKSNLRSKLKTYLKEVQNIHKTFLKKIGRYKILLEEHYEAYYQKLQTQLGNIHDQIEELEIQFGTEFNKTTVGNLKLLKAFSTKSKTALTLKTQLIDQFSALEYYFLKHKYFDFEFVTDTSNGNVELLKEQLTLFNKELQAWYSNCALNIQDKLNRLNAKTIHRSIDFETEVADLEKSIENLFTSINAEKLYKNDFQNHAMTLQLKQQSLEDLMEKLNLNLHYIHAFEKFYDWKRLWLTLTVKEKKIINALIKAKSENWQVTFDAWYFHNLLNHQNQDGVNFEEVLKKYLVQYQIVKEKVPNYIQHIWLAERKTAINTVKKQKWNTLSTFLKKTKNNEDFTSYFNQFFSTVTSFFPIIFMSVNTAKKLLGSTEANKFDNLIIQGGANLSKEQGGNMINHAHKVQVYGYGAHNFSTVNPSFWDLAKTLAGKHIFLKTQHRKTGMPLILFNNAAFGQNLEIKLNGSLDKASLLTYYVDGVYDESLRVNEDECRYMLSLLGEIEGTPQQTFPRVAFACATIEQRNHFAAYLLQIKQQRANGADKIKQMERNGMGVFTFEELSGQQFDVLLISFTFGANTLSGDICKDIEYFTTPKGEQSLHNLLNSGIQKVIICHSIPKRFINAQKTDRHKKAFFILSNFLEFAGELPKDNEIGLTAIMNRLSDGENAVMIEMPPIFLEQVAQSLLAYFEKDRIQRDVLIKNERYPLVIKGTKEGQQDYIIKVDPHFNNEDAYSYLWQEVVNEQLAAKGYKILPIWSKKWWRRPAQEARKLASIIIKEDAAFASNE